jgi:hypothetical protein
MDHRVSMSISGETTTVHLGYNTSLQDNVFALSSHLNLANWLTCATPLQKYAVVEMNTLVKCLSLGQASEQKVVTH